VLDALCDLDARKPYRIHDVIAEIADEQEFFEVQAQFARNVVVGFLRMEGQVAGVVANNPAHMAGALDIDAADKAARFVRFLNAFNLPIVTLVDVPGYWPGVQQEHGGIIRHGAKLLYAYAEASVPKVTVVLRKAYGGGYIAMSSKHLGSDVNFCLPSAEIAVMGAKGAVDILHSREIDQAPSLHDAEVLKARLCQEYTDRFASPYAAASTGSIDEVIEPSEMRSKIVRALRLLGQKRRRGADQTRGNIPL
jgi:propionyl-CoA carboxylase beta chain